MTDALLVFCTFPDESGASRTGRTLVRRRLAACVQVLGPISSIYRWQGRIESATEWLCIFKTTAARYPRLETALVRLHPYDTPEIVALPVSAASRRYLDWLAASTAPPSRRCR